VAYKALYLWGSLYLVLFIIRLIFMIDMISTYGEFAEILTGIFFHRLVIFECTN